MVRKKYNSSHYSLKKGKNIETELLALTSLLLGKLGASPLAEHDVPRHGPRLNLSLDLLGLLLLAAGGLSLQNDEKRNNEAIQKHETVGRTKRYILYLRTQKKTRK